MKENSTSFKIILRESRYRKLLFSNAVNRFGDSIDSIAFTWLVYQITHSAVWSAIVFGLNMLPKSLQISSNMAIALIMTGKTQNIKEAGDVIDWCLALYNATGNNKISYLTKMTAILLMIKAMCLACLDDRDNMRSCISEAYLLAKKFDKNPTNEIENRIKFWHGNSDYKPTMYDELGRGAVAGIDSLFSLEVSRKLPENVSEKIKEARVCWEEIKRGE